MFYVVGVEGDWTSKDFFCGCNNIPDIDDILEAVKPEVFVTDEEIADLEKNLQSGNVLSNTMYLWKHRGFDPALRKHYSEHLTLFNGMKTDEIIQRLEKILTVPGTVAEKQLFITEVILPEVLIQWLQGNSNMCRYQAESVLLTITSSKEKGAARKTAEDTDSTEEENILIRDSLAAADWCRKATFDGGLKLPAVLSMDREEKKKALQEMDTWNGELDEA
ncbi:uncharacterized protein LOC114567798 [Perca flavescens]|uniref:uncharacterized protein LOC114567798 n=1 Tax=Perca flavescens TaxID=8167 RepID=UPI00106E48C3|nr:uncharacterized protein LOC114567798 [Perca flavescens]